MITDVCLCEYTDHGHCGLVEDGEVRNDPTLERLAAAARLARPRRRRRRRALGHDGRPRRPRSASALDARGFEDVAILAYAAKFASAYYGPFREAAESAPAFGDRRGYQMDPPNRREALREMRLDLEEGADVLMVKPALPYLDVLADARRALRRAARRLPRLRRVRDDPRRRGARLARRPARDGGGARRDQARRRGLDPHLRGQGSGARLCGG